MPPCPQGHPPPLPLPLQAGPALQLLPLLPSLLTDASAPSTLLVEALPQLEQGEQGEQEGEEGQLLCLLAPLLPLSLLLERRVRRQPAAALQLSLAASLPSFLPRQLLLLQEEEEAGLLQGSPLARGRVTDSESLSRRSVCSC